MTRPVPPQNDPLFVYGSLMYDDVLLAVLDRMPLTIAGTTAGWSRRALRGLPYPAIVAEPDAETDGLILPDLTTFERGLLDDFEGPQYTVEPITVVTTDGPVQACAYVAATELDPIVELGPWDPSELDAVIDDYVAGCRAFRSAYLRALDA